MCRFNRFCQRRRAIMHEDDYLAISSLNDLLFCERRAALHLIEATWTDNVHTVSGTIAHRRVHRQRDSADDGLGNVRRGNRRP
jgi:CRISPR-associated exonuclease Cas4